MIGTRKGFTLLELLATVALLVVLGTMLFQVFQQASSVVQISNARQEIFQYARASLEFLERELSGAFVGDDADPSSGVRGMRVYSQNSMGANCDRRAGSQGIFFTAGIMARDTRPGTNYLKDVNCARIAYYLNNETTRLDKTAIYRTEMYDLSAGIADKGSPFIRNCLLFNIQVMSRYPSENPIQFQTMDWNSDATDVSGLSGCRRGMPLAIALTFRITDEHHAVSCHYKYGPMGGSDKWYVPGPDPAIDYWGQEDPAAQTFRYVVNYGHRSE